MKKEIPVSPFVEDVARVRRLPDCLRGRRYHADASLDRFGFIGVVGRPRLSLR